MKKILVFGMTSSIGGVECFIMNYYRNMDRNKVQFDFITYFDHIAFESEILSLGGKIYRITSRGKNYLKNHREFNSFMKLHAQEYCTVWSNLCTLSDIYLLKVAKKYKIRERIIHSHNSRNMEGILTQILHSIHKKVIKKYATDFWACSTVAGAFFYNNIIMHSEKYRIIHNSIDVDRFSFDPTVRNAVRKELNTEGKFVIGHIGRFHSQKNHILLLDIFKYVHDKNENVVLLLVGDGVLRPQIERKILDLKLEDCVILTGVRMDIRELYQAMDIFVFPSLYEGFPVTLVEAQAAGLPCIISDSITSEIKITNLIETMPLKANPSKWAERILKFSNDNERKDTSKQIRAAGYDIKEQSEWMENFYIKKSVEN